MITYILSIDFCILIYTIDETTIIRCLFDDDRNRAVTRGEYDEF